MAQDYFGIVTRTGHGLITAAMAGGQPVNLTHIALGDGGGNPISPTEDMTELVHEVHRAPINSLLQDSDNAAVLLAEVVLPSNVGGFYVREAGVFDEDGNLVAVAKTPESYKPELVEGSGTELALRIPLVLANVEAVTIKIDPTVVLASRSHVAAEVAAHDGDAGAHGALLAPVIAVIDDHVARVDNPHGVTPAQLGAAQADHTHDGLFLDPVARGNAAINALHCAALRAQVGPASMIDGVEDDYGDEGGISSKTNMVHYPERLFANQSVSEMGTIDGAYTGSNGTALTSGRKYGGYRFVPTVNFSAQKAVAAFGSVSAGQVKANLYVLGNPTPIATSGAVGVSAPGETQFPFGAAVSLTTASTYVLEFEWISGSYNFEFTSTPAVGLTIQNVVIEASHLYQIYYDNNASVSEPMCIGFEALTTSESAQLVSATPVAGALAPPEAMALTLLMRPLDSVTVNTDLTAHVSRDGGTTWTQISLAAQTLLDNLQVLTGEADVTAQPSGTDPRYKIDCLNHRGLELEGAVIQWR